MPWATDFKIVIMESFTPRTLISGRTKITRSRDRETAFSAAAAVLGTERIALIHTRFKGDIWYLAAPAADLASHPQCTAPLSAALPGTRDHEGEGAYTTDLPGGLQAVVVKNGPNLHSFVGTPTMVKRFIALEGAKETLPCTAKGLPWQFASEMIGRREARLNAAITVSGLVVALLGAGAWLWAAHNQTRLEELRLGLGNEQRTAWTQALRSLEPQAYPKALANLQKAVEQAIKEKGALVQFEYKDGRATWTLNVNYRVVTGGSN